MKLLYQCILIGFVIEEHVDACWNYNIFCFVFSIAVPNVYPVDLFEHMWIVDRLQRLGVSRYFKEEIKECINYVSR